MSAADRMVVRTLDGSYRSVPRRQGLGMIAAGRAQAAPAPLKVGDEVITSPEIVPDPVFGPVADAFAGPDAATAVLAAVVPDEAVPDPELPDGEPDDYDDWPDDAEPAAELPAEPRGNASRQEWAAYAHDIGVEVHSGMSRNQIRDAAQDAAQSLARLPQPALPGGRLETPEDEPVTEESVTDDEDPGTR